MRWKRLKTTALKGERQRQTGRNLTSWYPSNPFFRNASETACFQGTTQCHCDITVTSVRSCFYTTVCHTRIAFQYLFKPWHDFCSEHSSLFAHSPAGFEREEVSGFFMIQRLLRFRYFWSQSNSSCLSWERLSRRLKSTQFFSRLCHIFLETCSFIRSVRVTSQVIRHEHIPFRIKDSLE